MKHEYKADLDENGEETGSGWATFQGLNGFEPYAVRVRVEPRNGRPTCAAVHLDPLAKDAPEVTAPLLARLPLARLVSIVTMSRDFTMQPDLQEELRRLASGDDTPIRDPRAATTPKEVAEIWLLAYYKGDRAPQAAVCKALNISPRTALNYIDKAEQMGLIRADLRPRKNRPKTKNKDR